MKTTKFLILILITGIIITSCQHAPKANDEEVKKKAIESALNFIYTQLSYLDKQIILCEIKGENDLAEFYKGLHESKTESQLYDSSNDFIKPVLDSLLKIGELKIENIRIDKNNNELKKCECSADLKMGLVSFPISYMAQYTEDGKLIVETQFK